MSRSPGRTITGNKLNFGLAAALLILTAGVGWFVMMRAASKSPTPPRTVNNSEAKQSQAVGEVNKKVSPKSIVAKKISRKKVIFVENFAGKEPLQKFSGNKFGSLVTVPGRGKVLRIRVGDEQPKGKNLLTLDLPLTGLRGCSLDIEAMLKTENISKEDKPYHTAKLQLRCTYPEEGKTFEEIHGGSGSKDWRSVRFRGVVPFDATGAKLSIGLDLCRGTAWYDDIKVTVHRAPPPPLTAQEKTAPIFKGHSLKRLRGTTIFYPNHLTEADMKTLAQEWGANLVRWRIQYPWLKDRTKKLAFLQDMNKYQAWIDEEIIRLDQGLTWCKKYGVMAVIDLQSAPGGRTKSNDSFIFRDEKYRKVFVATWEKLARHYKGNPNVWGYDLCNEPVLREIIDVDGPDWTTLAERVAKAIRVIDPDTPIIVECEIGGSIKTLLSKLVPIKVPKVIYSFHMYRPYTLTHQGVRGRALGAVYPGKIDEIYWDKAQLRKVLQPVLAFQKRYHVQIYVGEFSCIRWAPKESPFRYLTDCIDLFEEFGWDWTYHSYREKYDGWSVEYGADRNNHTPTATPTKRELLLRKWFAKNERAK